MITQSGPAASRAPSTASRNSSRSANVSRISRSAPAPSSAPACSRKKARASSNDVGPSGSIGTPSGPMVPATNGPPRAASRARRTPASLIAISLSARPNPPRRTRFAPNVFVSRISAPASTYSRWICVTRSGAERLSSSKQRLMKMPREYSIVPNAPSATRTRSDRASRNSSARGEAMSRFSMRFKPSYLCWSSNRARRGCRISGAADARFRRLRAGRRCTSGEAA